MARLHRENCNDHDMLLEEAFHSANERKMEINTEAIKAHDSVVSSRQQGEKIVHHRQTDRECDVM